MKVRVYYNLHKKLLSVQTKVNGSWKVVDHVGKISLVDVEFKVFEKGRLRVIKNKRKNVHAYIQGFQVSNDLPLSLAENAEMSLISYNPFKFERFHDGNKYVDHAKRVCVSGRRVYALAAE